MAKIIATSRRYPIQTSLRTAIRRAAKIHVYIRLEYQITQYDDLLLKPHVAFHWHVIPRDDRGPVRYWRLWLNARIAKNGTILMGCLKNSLTNCVIWNLNTKSLISYRRVVRIIYQHLPKPSWNIDLRIFYILDGYGRKSGVKMARHFFFQRVTFWGLKRTSNLKEKTMKFY